MKKIIMGVVCAMVALFATVGIAEDQVQVNLWTCDNNGNVTNGCGYVKCGRYSTLTGDGSVVITNEAGTVLTAKAYANRGYVFRYWLVTDPAESFCVYDNSYSFTMSNGVDLYAYFVTPDEDAITIDDSINFEFAANKMMNEFDLSACVQSLSKPTVSVSGLPAGVKFDAKTGIISGTPINVKSGMVKISVKNLSGNKATKEIPYEVAPLEWNNCVPGEFTSEQPVGLDFGVKYDFDSGLFIETTNKNVKLTAKNLPAGFSLKKYAKDEVYGYYLAGKATRKSYAAWYDVEIVAQVGNAKTSPKVQRFYVDMPRVQVNTIYVEEKDSAAENGGIAFLEPHPYYSSNPAVPATLAGYVYYFLETGYQYYYYNSYPYDVNNRYGSSNPYVSYAYTGYPNYGDTSDYTVTLAATNTHAQVFDSTDFNEVDTAYAEVDGSARYVAGQRVKLVAKAKPGYVFAGWRVVTNASFRIDQYAHDGWANYCRRSIQNGGYNQQYNYCLPAEIADVDLVQQAQYDRVNRYVYEQIWRDDAPSYSEPDYYYWSYMYDHETGAYRYCKSQYTTYQTNLVSVIGYQPIKVAKFDFREPNYTFTMGDEDVTYYALYVKKSTDMKPDSLAITIKAAVGTNGPTEDGEYHWQENGSSWQDPGTEVIQKDTFFGYDNIKTIAENGTYYCMVYNEIDPIELADNSQSLATYTVKGLPAGLKFDAKAKTITGTPTVASKNGPSVVTVTIKNANGIKATTTFKIWVAPLAKYAVGTFKGVVSMDAGVNGVFTLTVDKKGKATGSIQVAGYKTRSFKCTLSPMVVTKKMTGSASQSQYWEDGEQKTDWYVDGSSFTEVLPYVQMYVADAKFSMMDKNWDIELNITSRTTAMNLLALDEADDKDAMPYEFSDLSYDLVNGEYPNYYNTQWLSKYWVARAHGVAVAFITEEDDDSDDYRFAFAAQLNEDKSADLRIKNVDQFNYFLESEVAYDARYISSTKTGTIKYSRMIGGKRVVVTATVIPVYGRNEYGLQSIPGYPSSQLQAPTYNADETFLHYAIVGIFENENGDLVVDRFFTNNFADDFECDLCGEGDPFEYEVAPQ